MILTALAAWTAPPHDYLCNYARISWSVPVVVRMRHADRSKRVTRLPHGAIVYICDDYWNDDLTNRWVQISFRAERLPCDGNTQGLREHLAATCRTGWVRERDVDVLSG